MGIFSKWRNGWLKLPFDKTAIENAIAQLETQTSAELRVFIESKKKVPNGKKSSEFSPLERALQVFDDLQMQATQARNGVLIYIAFSDHQCVVMGDKGIDHFVLPKFWQQQCDLMTACFKQGHYTEGMVKVIEKIGVELTAHFPYLPDDQNELDNEVIIND